VGKNGKNSSKMYLFLILMTLILASPIILRELYSTDITSITGDAASSVMILSTNEFLTCDVPMIAGWNLISIFCDANDMSISEVFETVDGKYISIHNYDRYDPTDKWKAYNPSLPPWVIQDLNTISVVKGYWVNMNTSGEIIFNGSLKYPRLVFLFEGWNLIGYPRNETQLVNDSFDAIISDLDSVHTYIATNSTDHWKVYSPTFGPAENDLHYMILDYGYWVKMDNNATWMVEE